jgi:hypothetical protein
LKRQRVSHPNDGIAEDVELGELIDDEEEEEFEVDVQDPNLVHGINDGMFQICEAPLRLPTQEPAS